MADKLGIATPWMTWAREIHEMFKDDPEVSVEFDNDALELTLKVANATKADALGRIMPLEKQFGNVKVKVTIVPANEDMSDAEVVRRAFAGNPAVLSVETIQDVFGTEISYVLFLPKVVSFPNDDLSDINGCTHTLYQDIARETFDCGAGVRFCTGLPYETPLGEWP